MTRTCQIANCTNDAIDVILVWVDGSEHTAHVCLEHSEDEE